MGFVNSIAAMCRGYVPWLIDHLEYKATSAIDHVIQVSPTGPRGLGSSAASSSEEGLVSNLNLTTSNMHLNLVLLESKTTNSN